MVLKATPTYCKVSFWLAGAGPHDGREGIAFESYAAYRVRRFPILAEKPAVRGGSVACGAGIGAGLHCQSSEGGERTRRDTIFATCVRKGCVAFVVLHVGSQLVCVVTFLICTLGTSFQNH